MKKLLLHILLLSYAVVIFKPVLPFVNDCIGHVFFYAHHMATVHFENGKYHVHYETAKDAKDERSDKYTTASKKDNLTSEHIVTTIKTTPFICNLTQNIYSYTNIGSSVSGYLENNYPPPRL